MACRSSPHTCEHGGLSWSGDGDGKDAHLVLSLLRANRLLFQLDADIVGQLCAGNHIGYAGPYPEDVIGGLFLKYLGLVSYIASMETTRRQGHICICTTETKSIVALVKVSRPQHSSHRLSLLDLQVAGLQGCANSLGPKSLWRGRESNPGLLLTWQMLYILSY
jgi:hypothetical protein